MLKIETLFFQIFVSSAVLKFGLLMGEGPDNQYTGKITLLMLSCIDGLLIYCRATYF